MEDSSEGWLKEGYGFQSRIALKMQILSGLN